MLLSLPSPSVMDIEAPPTVSTGSWLSNAVTGSGIGESVSVPESTSDGGGGHWSITHRSSLSQSLMSFHDVGREVAVGSEG